MHTLLNILNSYQEWTLDIACECREESPAKDLYLRQGDPSLRSGWLPGFAMVSCSEFMVPARLT